MKMFFNIVARTFVLSLMIASAWASDLSRSNAYDLSVSVRDKTDQSLTAHQLQSLQKRDGERIKVWVFFTDKGIFTKEQLQTRAASMSLTDRSARRRAKVGRDRIMPADIRVNVEYIESITNLGAQHRRSSRWLNAASFEISPGQLSAIEELPFVAEIRPLVVFRRPLAEASEVRFDDIRPSVLSPDVLNYGISADQLYQMNVPAMHEAGYDGAGVTLAIFDTGFRKSHEAFAQHYADGRVLAEWDFIFDDGNTANEPEDWDSQWNHGTYIWSTSAGYLDGTVYGPAYRSNFILCKTEDVRSETQVEEDNWVAALEWVDSIGADVVTSSLSYEDFDDGSGYSFEDLDGYTGVTSAAASMAADMGIVVCNSAGNSGPSPSTCYPPADAHEILTCGAVDEAGLLANFSSRGPTADDRLKPEVVARGVNTQCATASSDNSYGGVNGTSLSTPLIAGVACLLVQAHPTYTPHLIRLAIMETADNADAPNNNYGWGLINAVTANGWGADFGADPTFGFAPSTVNFYDSSTLPTSTWKWSFGDGDSALVQNPVHEYAEAGVYDVSLTINSDYGPITMLKPDFVILLADTATFETDSGYAGGQVELSVNLTNTQPLQRIQIPFKFEDLPPLTLDSVARGTRTAYFESLRNNVYNPVANTYGWYLLADTGLGSPPLPVGSGEVLKIFFSIGAGAGAGTVNTIDSVNGSKMLECTSELLTYQPAVIAGSITVLGTTRGDVNGDGEIDIADLVYLVNYMFNSGPAPVTPEAGNIDGMGNIDIADLVYLVNYMFNGGPPPPA
ncbi:MAG: S8 family serine peptidase [bacterium]